MRIMPLKLSDTKIIGCELCDNRIDNILYCIEFKEDKSPIYYNNIKTTDNGEFLITEYYCDYERVAISKRRK